MTIVSVRYLLPALDLDWMASTDAVLDARARAQGGKLTGSGVDLVYQERDRAYGFPGPEEAQRFERSIRGGLPPVRVV